MKISMSDPAVECVKAGTTEDEGRSELSGSGSKQPAASEIGGRSGISSEMSSRRCLDEVRDTDPTSLSGL